MVQSVRSGLPKDFKIFDTHAQFHTGDTARYPMREDIEAGIRAHTIKTPVTPEIILPIWDRLGVVKGCAVQVEYAYGVDNRYLLDIAERYRSRLSPVVILNPLDPASPAALMSMAKAYGASAVRFAGAPRPDGHYSFLMDVAHGCWEVANELGLAIVLLPNSLEISTIASTALPASMKRIGKLADRYPRVEIVIDHFGFPVFANTPTFGFSPEHLALASYKNVYLKHSQFVIGQLEKARVPARDFIDYAVHAFGDNRFVWGSATGNNSIEFLGRYPGGELMTDPQRYGENLAVALASAAGLSMAQKRAMFHDTAQKVFIPGGRLARKA